MARIPRNQLLDALFTAFREREHWSVKQLRERTQQPEAYLKEVLSEIAFMHRSGEHNGTWELMANFKGDGVSSIFLCPLCAFDTPYRSKERTSLSQISLAKASKWRMMMTRKKKRTRATTTMRTWRRFHERPTLTHGLI